MNLELRKPTKDEYHLLELLMNKAELSLDQNKHLMVKNMDDGGMGSLLLFPSGKDSDTRNFGKQVSDLTFFDQDGVEVIASLNIDERGNIFELDMWKTNFDELKDMGKSLK